MKARAGLALLVFAMSAAACAGVLGIRPPAPRPFQHHAHSVKGVPCRDCHAGIGTAGDVGELHLPTDADCRRCHTKPHDERSCGPCHEMPHAREEAQMAKAAIRFRHDTHLPRMRGECIRCHPGVTSDAERVRPPMALCLSCHAHADEVATRHCGTCHEDLPAERTPPADHFAHDGDFLREHGTRAAGSPELCATCHSNSSCARCHGKTVAALPERFTVGDPLSAGLHRAGFFSRHASESRAQPGLCTTCHATDSCESCHARRGVSAPSGKGPHPAGWLGVRGESNEHGRAAWRDPAECASCHAGAGEALCVGCHRVGALGGNPHRPGWTSTKRPTVDAPCRLCHGGIP